MDWFQYDNGFRHERVKETSFNFDIWSQHIFQLIFRQLVIHNSFVYYPQTFTSLKSAIETLEKGMEYDQS